ncbi:MAG TPA: hypothetical protein VK726_07515 [Acetobacteraceae bacterium]|nr:hypothetical protein [Acetobacteraceae bacterium]
MYLGMNPGLPNAACTSPVGLNSPIRLPRYPKSAKSPLLFRLKPTMSVPPPLMAKYPVALLEVEKLATPGAA